MITDGICAAIILVSALWYGWKGFALSIMSMLQWFVTIVTSLYFCDDLSGYLKGTKINDSINSYFKEKFSQGISENPIARIIPDTFNGWTDQSTDYVTEVAAGDLTRIVLIIMSFFILVVGVKILCLLFSLLFKKEKSHGFIGLIDRILGFGLGITMGFLYVLLLLALLVPLMGFLPEGTAETLDHSLKHSFFSGSLFQNNFLIHLMRGLFF